MYIGNLLAVALRCVLHVCFHFELDFWQFVLGVLFRPLLVFWLTLSLSCGMQRPGGAPKTFVLDTRWRLAVEAQHTVVSTSCFYINKCVFASPYCYSVRYSYFSARLLPQVLCASQYMYSNFFVGFSFGLAGQHR